MVTLALAEPDLSPRELAVRFTEGRRYYLSESTVYRILKRHDLITAPAFIVLKAAERFANPTTAVNQLWQTDFTYLKVSRMGLVLPVHGAGTVSAGEKLDQEAPRERRSLAV